MLARLWGYWITHTLLVGITIIQPPLKTVIVSKINMQLPYNPLFVLLGMCFQKWKLCSLRNLGRSAHWRFINNPKLKTTEMSFSGWMIKQTVVHLYYGILLSNEKKWTTHIHKNLHNPQGNYAIFFKKRNGNRVVARVGSVRVKREGWMWLRRGYTGAFVVMDSCVSWPWW